MKIIEKKIRYLLYRAFLMSVLCMFSACSDDDGQNVTNVPDDWIQGLPESVMFKVNGGEQSLAFTLAEGLEASRITYIMPEDAESWCNISVGNDHINIKVTPFGYSRVANITLIYDGNHTKRIKAMQISDFSDYFEDDVCSKLKEGITEDQIQEIANPYIKEVALKLFNNTYDAHEKEFRVASFRPYQHPEIMSKKNKTGLYSLRDNVTGIWAREGEDVCVMVGDIYENGKISLMFHGPDKGYNNVQTVLLTKGFNKIAAPITGQIYVMNHVEDDFLLNPEIELKDDANALATHLNAIKSKTVNIHFLTGNVCGYIDINKHLNTTQDASVWKNILENADYEFIDLVGHYAHITWKATQFREKGTDLKQMLKRFDDIVYQEQEFAGLEKYKQMFRNRFHFCANYTAATCYAAAYHAGFATSPDKDGGWDNVFYDLDSNKRRLWVLGHESGHINQLTPGVKWTGLSEVTNNIYCLYQQFISWGGYTKLDNVQTETGYSPELAQCQDENGNYIPSSGQVTLYELAKEVIVRGKRAHSLPTIKHAQKQHCKLVPFWQLYLYVVKAQGVEDFYKDLYQHFRENDSPSEKGANQGMDQLDFVRQACKYSGYDLTEFFEQWGFLTPVNALVDDYTSRNLVITNKDVATLKEEIKNAGYKKAHAEIYNITDKTWMDYQGEPK